MIYLQEDKLEMVKIVVESKRNDSITNLLGKLLPEDTVTSTTESLDQYTAYEVGLSNEGCSFIDKSTRKLCCGQQLIMTRKPLKPFLIGEGEIWIQHGSKKG